MSKKFTTVVTVQGMQLLNQAIADQIDLALIKAVASTSAYPPEMLETLTDDNYKSANKAQETTINKSEPRGDGTLAMEIVFDGNDIQYDYTLNTVFIVAEVAGKERLFAVIRANQPQYMNSYDGSSRTNLQINFALKLDNSGANITIDSAALATTKDLNDLKDEITGKFEAGDRSLKQEIAKNKQDVDKDLNEVFKSLEDSVALVNKNISRTKDELTKSFTSNIGAERTRAERVEDNITTELRRQVRSLEKSDQNIYKAIGDVKVVKFNLLNSVNVYDNIKFCSNAIVSSSVTSKGYCFSLQPDEELGGNFDLYFDIPLTTERIKENSQYIVELEMEQTVNNSDQNVQIGFASNGSYLYSSPNRVSFEANKRIKITKGVHIHDIRSNLAIRISSDAFRNTTYLHALRLYDPSEKVAFYPNDLALLNKANSNAVDIVAKELSANKKERKAPMSWMLDRSTTPWTIWFDNDCGIQFPDYATTDTIYGYGYGNIGNLPSDKFSAFPLVFSIIRCAQGVITVDDFRKKNGVFDYWSPTTKVINPLQDASRYAWSNAYGDPGTNNDQLKRKPNFARIMYELGIWSDADVISLGARKR